jgi:hypothetical protein
VKEKEGEVGGEGKRRNKELNMHTGKLAINS